MGDFPRFLLARNRRAEPGADYIVHTKDPVLLARVRKSGNEIFFDIIYQEENNFPKEKLEGLIRRMSDWYRGEVSLDTGGK